MTRAVLSTVPTDPSTVENTLHALAPRWTMWITSTLLHTPRPMQRRDLEDALPFVPASTMGLRLTQLRTLGLIARPGTSQRAPMQLTDHGHALSPLCTALSAWAGHHLDLGTTANVERAEQALHRLALTDTPKVLQLLTDHGQLRLAEVADALGQSHQLAVVRLRRMQDDGLIERTGTRLRDPYQLTAAARDLPPVFTAAHQWARRTVPAQPAQHASALTSLALTTTAHRRPVPGVPFSDLASAPASSYAAADQAGRPGAVRR